MSSNVQSITNIATTIDVIYYSIVEIYLADLRVPKKRFMFTVLFERFFFLSRKKGFQLVISLYFCVVQQKKKTLEKNC